MFSRTRCLERYKRTPFGQDTNSINPIVEPSLFSEVSDWIFLMLTSKAKGTKQGLPTTKQTVENKQDIKAHSLELAYLSYNIYKLKAKAKIETKVRQDV